MGATVPHQTSLGHARELYAGDNLVSSIPLQFLPPSFCLGFFALASLNDQP